MNYTLNVRKPVKFDNERYNPFAIEKNTVLLPNDNRNDPYIALSGVISTSSNNSNLSILAIPFSKAADANEKLVAYKFSSNDIGKGEDQYHLACDLSYINYAIDSSTCAIEDGYEFRKEVSKHVEYVNPDKNKSRIVVNKPKSAKVSKSKDSESDLLLTIYSPEEAASILGFGMNTMYELLNSGKIKAIKNGRIWKISKKALCDYVSEESISA